MIAFIILGIIDLIAGLALYMSTEIYIIKFLAMILIAKGAISLFKNFFNY